MDWGLKNRLSRIIRSDGRTVMLAVDHGYFLGADVRSRRRGEDDRAASPSCRCVDAHPRGASHISGSAVRYADRAEGLRGQQYSQRIIE